MDFELNKPDWYTPQNVEENDFLGSDSYGNTWYSVKFENDAGTHLWLAKERPEEGKAYYGHFEKTKSGKSLRFKRDQVPEDAARPKSAASSAHADDKQFLKDISDTPLRVFTASIGYFDTQALGKDDRYYEAFMSFIRKASRDLYNEMTKLRTAGPDALQNVQEVFPEAEADLGWIQDEQR